MNIVIKGQGTCERTTTAIANASDTPYRQTLTGVAYTLGATPAAGWRFVRWELTQTIEDTGYRQDHSDAWIETRRATETDNPVAHGITAQTLDLPTSRAVLFEGTHYDDFWGGTSYGYHDRTVTYGSLLVRAVFSPLAGPILRAANGTILRASTGAILRQG